MSHGYINKKKKTFSAKKPHSNIDPVFSSHVNIAGWPWVQIILSKKGMQIDKWSFFAKGE